MGRLWQSGFELNSTSNGVEVTAVSGTGTVSTIASTTVRSGTYAAKFLANNIAIGQMRYNFAAADQTAPYYFRIYFYLTTPVAAATNLLIIRNTANLDKIGLRLNTDNTLTLRNLEDAASIGSDSAALSTGQWYRLELLVDTTTIANTGCTARIDGVDFATGNANLATGVAAIVFGMSAIFATGEFYIDDIAINDSSGASQNSWPGPGAIVHRKPNAVGDNSTWTATGAATGWESTDEVTPDNDTTYVRNSTTLNQADDYNIEASGLTTETISCVAVGFVGRGETATTNQYQFTVRAKKAASGTVSESGNINLAVTSHTTNAGAAPKNYPLVLYQDPDGGTITGSQLDNWQIGVKTSVTSTNRVRISTLWLSIDYAPAAPPPGGGTNSNFLALM